MKKKYKINREKIKLLIFIVFFIALGLYVSIKFKSEKINVPKTQIETDIMLNGNSEHSNGYDHGIVYSIDGEPISKDYTINNMVKHAGIPEFTPIIGMEGFGGLINQCDITLHSSARKENIDSRTGNNIQTTLSYKAQCIASSLLKEYFPSEVCDGASLAVVLKDGSVLVAAGSNSYSVDEFGYDNYPNDMCIDKTAENYDVGSVAKTITAATLLMNDDYVDEEYSLYNERFEDLSFYIHGGNRIENHDYCLPEAYEKVIGSDNQMARYIGLDEAFVYSSNTYFWRHALNFGLEQTFKAMDNIFEINKSIKTEINTINSIQIDPERLDYFFWGQDFNASPVLLCSMYNFIFSGEKFSPFYITSVCTPDNHEIYRATPQKTASMSQNEKMKNILEDSLSKCLKSYCQNIDKNVWEKYSNLIEEGRIIAKSGTADVITNEIINHTRVITILDENHDVICTATIAVNRAKNKYNTANDNILFNILFNTLEAAGIL